MEDELRAAPPSYRNAMSTKVRLYRRDLGKLQRDMKTSTSGFGFSRLPDEGSRGIYSSENQQSVSFCSCHHPERPSVVGFLKINSPSDASVLYFDFADSADTPAISESFAASRHPVFE